MSLDPTRNFLKQTLATGYLLSATAITLPDATRFPNPATEGAFNLTWWNVTDYPDPADDPNKEIVRVTAISGNIATVTRGQEGTTATAKNLSGKNYQIALALTKKVIDDIDGTLESLAGDISNLETVITTIEGDITQIEGDLGVVEGDITALQSGKQDNLGFTPENVANKENTTLDTSTTKYPTNRLVKEAVDAKQNSLGFTPENIANKSTDVSTDGSSDTKYPSVKAIKDYADNLVAGLLDYRGGYDASVNTFPTTGGSGTAGAIKKGDMFIISVNGTLGGNAVQVGDSLIASIDTPGQTASNWNILNANISYIPEDVANKATTITGNEASDTKYGTIKAIYDWSTGLFATQSALSGYVPTSRTLTINGTTQDLSSNRSWTIAVPTKTSDLTNDSGFITSSALSGYLQNNVGIAGGTTLIGGTASGDNLTLVSTSHATKGKILFGTSAYDEVNNRLGIGTITPSAYLHIKAGTASASTAPLKFTAGTNLTTPEQGTVEYASSEFFFTPSTTRASIMHTDLTSFNTYSRNAKGATAFTTGARNFLVGSQAGASLTTGNDNFIVGLQAGGGNISDGIIIGQYAGNGMGASANGAIALGNRAGYQATSAINSIFIGRTAGYNTTSVSNVIFMGLSAGESSSGANGGVFIGYLAGQNAFNAAKGVFLGYQAGKSASGAINTVAIGENAGLNAKGSVESIFVGKNSGYNAVSTGITGDFNLGLGTDTLKALTTGAGNIALGYKVGDTITTGSKNVAIGYDIDYQSNTADGQLTIQNIIFGTGNTGTGTTASTGGIGIGGEPDACALFEVKSTVKGLLLPRMTTTQRDAIASPVNGLVVYNTTTEKINVYTTAWEAVTSA